VTIAACYSLVEDGKIPLSEGMTRVQFDTNVGNIPLEIYFTKSMSNSGTSGEEGSGAALDIDGDTVGTLEKIMMHQHTHSFRPSPVPVDDIAAVLGIESLEIKQTGLPVVVASYDMDYLLIPIKHKETILEMNPDLIKLGMLNREYGISTNHIFTLDTFDPNCASYARHFGPVVGLWEDPASAMASGGLGSYLLTYGITDSDSMILEQGMEADSLARIRVELERKDDEIKTIRVGGLAFTSIAQKIRIENEKILTV
jgi:PhzF family phenazine biosynthesis protein